MKELYAALDKVGGRQGSLHVWWGCCAVGLLFDVLFFLTEMKLAPKLFALLFGLLVARAGVVRCIEQRRDPFGFTRLRASGH